MALQTGGFTTYHAKGNKEDFLDVITNIDPVNNWMTKNFASKSAQNTLHQWQTDTLKAASAVGSAQIEGNAYTGQTATATSTLGNYTQIINDTFVVTDTQEAVGHYGRGSEIGYQLEKALKNIANGVEYVVAINTATAAGDSGTARQAKGVRGWITTNTATGAATAFTGATATTLLNGVLEDIWDAGGNPKYIVCGMGKKILISNLTANNTRWTAADDKAITFAVDLYKSDAGDLAIIPHRHFSNYASTDLVILGELNLWGIAYLRKPKSEKMARRSTATEYLVETEFTVESLQEKGAGLIRLT